MQFKCSGPESTFRFFCVDCGEKFGRRYGCAPATIVTERAGMPNVDKAEVALQARMVHSMGLLQSSLSIKRVRRQSDCMTYAGISCSVIEITFAVTNVATTSFPTKKKRNFPVLEDTNFSAETSRISSSFIVFTLKVFSIHHQSATRFPTSQLEVILEARLGRLGYGKFVTSLRFRHRVENLHVRDT